MVPASESKSVRRFINVLRRAALIGGGVPKCTGSATHLPPPAPRKLFVLGYLHSAIRGSVRLPCHPQATAASRLEDRGAGTRYAPWPTGHKRNETAGDRSSSPGLPDRSSLPPPLTPLLVASPRTTLRWPSR